MSAHFLRRILFAGAASLIPAFASAQGHFLRGDSNHDREIDVSDAVTTLLHLFVGAETPPCLDALDFDDSGSIEITDAIGLLRFAFTGGAAPAAPFPVFEADPTPDALACLPEVPGSVTAGGSILTGEITQDVTLRADKTYRIVSGAYMKPGTTLTIEPGVTIFGDSATRAFLALERGARIFAVGTRTHPVVFTSDKPVGQRRAGDWGGVIVCGRAPANPVGGEWVVKGFQSLVAGGGSSPDPEESSGRMSYVRVEYAGGDVMGYPLTALTFAAVGSGTQLDHIMAKEGRDDGLEWYGGTSSLKYALAVGIEDDGIDCEYGWQGRVQFAVCFQKPSAGNHGWQAAEDDTQPLLEPRTVPTLSNVTLLGAYASGSRSAGGLRLRRWAGANFFNGIIQGWHEAGVLLSSNFGPVDVDRTAFYGNATNCSGSTTVCTTLFSPPHVNVAATGPLVMDAEHLEHPNLRGIASRLPPVLDPALIDPWFDSVSYVGAVPPEGEGDDWTHEPWISWERS
ncbi:MAG: hypothetical protein ACUVYA_02655 [Planctomycetota bacterium]